MRTTEAPVRSYVLLDSKAPIVRDTALRAAQNPAAQGSPDAFVTAPLVSLDRASLHYQAADGSWKDAPVAYNPYAGNQRVAVVDAKPGPLQAVLKAGLLSVSDGPSGWVARVEGQASDDMGSSHTVTALPFA